MKGKTKQRRAVGTRLRVVKHRSRSFVLLCLNAAYLPWECASLDGNGDQDLVTNHVSWSFGAWSSGHPLWVNGIVHRQPLAACEIEGTLLLVITDAIGAPSSS